MNGKRYFVRRVCRDCKVVIDVETFRNNAGFDVVGYDAAVFEFDVKLANLVARGISALVGNNRVDDYVLSSLTDALKDMVKSSRSGRLRAGVASDTLSIADAKDKNISDC